MNEEIKKQFDSIHQLQKTTWNELKVISAHKEIPKNKRLATQDIPFNYEVFLVKGILRSYYITDDGKEYTTSFYTEGSFISPAFTRQSEGKSLLHIQALADSKVILFTEHQFTELRYKFKDLFVLGSKVSEKELMLKSMKEVLLATGNLRELYSFFQRTYPNLENSISQRYIASYMGVDPASLSRIRSQILKAEKHT